MSETLREHARGLAALGRVTRALAGSRDARPAVCRAACEVAAAPVAFMLEPSGREFVSTAMVGVDIAPVTIQPRPEAEYGGRAFTSRQSYFVADARTHPALAAPLVEATGARSALFEPVLRGDQIAGVLILIWRHAVDAVPDAVAEMLGVLASQAAVAIEREELRSRVGALALSDPLTGLPTRRTWDDELPREIARARRSESPLTVAVIDLDHLSAFNMLRGEQEGDRLVKEASSSWRAQLREVDTLARLEGAELGLILPDCGLGEACEVLDRVRASTPRGQTASAGVARWDGEEPGGPAARALHGRARRRQGRRARHDDRRGLAGERQLRLGRRSEPPRRDDCHLDGLLRIETTFVAGGRDECHLKHRMGGRDDIRRAGALRTRLPPSRS